jgi:predicted transcriptional regulator
LWLLAGYVGFRLDLVESDALSREELQAKLGKSAKITSTRLGELVKNDLVMKTADDKYKITSFGIVQMQKEIIPKIKTKLGGRS